MEYVGYELTENEKYMRDVQFERNEYGYHNKKIQNIVFIISNSSSMAGCKISTVNSALEEFVPELIDISENNLEVEIRISIMSVSDCTRWESFLKKADKDYKFDYLVASEIVEFNALSAIELLRRDFIDKYNERTDFLQPIFFGL